MYIYIDTDIYIYIYTCIYRYISIALDLYRARSKDVHLYVFYVRRCAAAQRVQRE